MNSRKAVFFDLDGTLFTGLSSERRFINYLLSKKIIKYKDIFKTFLFMLLNILKGYQKFLSSKRYYLKNMDVKEVEKLAENFYNDVLSKIISKDAKNKIIEYKNNGDLLILITGTPHFIAKVIAEKLGFHTFEGTTIGSSNGKFNGNIESIFPYGINKVYIYERYLKKYNLKEDICVAYANRFSDRFLLKRVGKPVSVNPDILLFLYSLIKSWKIERWKSNKI